MMSLWTFWSIKVVVALLSMEGQKALRFHLHWCSEDEWKSYGFRRVWKGLEWHEGE